MKNIYKQRTINSNILLKGIGIHNGEDNVINLRPKETEGIVFYNGSQYELSLNSISNTFLSTDIGNIKTTEHLLSVLNIFEITNLDVEMIYGNEIPIYDGCSNTFFNKIKEVGIKEFNETIEYEITEDIITYQHNNSSYKYIPSNKNEFYIKCTYNNIEYNSIMNTDIYYNDISKFKTFCKEEDIDKLLLNGYGNGGNKNNTILYDPNKKTDEYVKHKVLDFIGDLYVIGFPLRGYFEVNNPSHYYNNLFVEEIFKSLRR